MKAKKMTPMRTTRLTFYHYIVYGFGGFAWAYAPDVSLRDWAQREAFLELRRREKAGLPPIDPNYVNPKSVKLPKDAEMCDVEIVI